MTTLTNGKNIGGLLESKGNTRKSWEDQQAWGYLKHLLDENTCQTAPEPPQRPAHVEEVGASLQADDSTLRIRREFETARTEINETVAGLRTRVFKMVQEELQGVFAEILRTPAGYSQLSEASGSTGGAGPSHGSSGYHALPAREALGRTHIAGGGWSPHDDPRNGTGPGAASRPAETPLERPSREVPASEGTLRPAPVSNQPPVAREETDAAPPTSQDDGDYEAALEDETEVYEGTVRLRVNVAGAVNQALRFVNEVSQKPQVRFLRLVGNRVKQLDLWVGLREPLPIRSMLREMPEVSRVYDVTGHDSKDGDHQLAVMLAAGAQA